MPISFSPSIYEHAAYLVGKRPWEVSRDPHLLFEGQLKGYELYDPAVVVVGVDIYNLEAEAYGGVVVDPGDDGIPAVVEPPFASLDEALELRPFDPATAGRLPMVIDCGRRLARYMPAEKVRIPVSGPFSIATSLLGAHTLLLESAMRPQKVRDLLFTLVEGQMLFCRAIVDAGLGVAMFESGAVPPLLSPAQFTEIELPPLRLLMQRLRDELGVQAQLVLGGNTAPILDAMLATGSTYLICPTETDREAFMAKVAQHPHVTVRVNIPIHPVVHGPLERLHREVDTVVQLAKRVPNAILLGTGAVPYETPPENILAIRRYAAQLP